ncbi:hypothetical protein, partial [Pseudomonas aeruginosa]|uniref:hypothetical protein n=1 Tax=Pseudomonas aeruginosa TaxID=287 RepID=UPI001F17A1D4
MVLIIIKRHLPGNRPGLMNADITQPGNQLERRIAGNLPSGNHPAQPAGASATLPHLLPAMRRNIKVAPASPLSRRGALADGLAPAVALAAHRCLLGTPA